MEGVIVSFGGYRPNGPKRLAYRRRAATLPKPTRTMLAAPPRTLADMKPELPDTEPELEGVAALVPLMVLARAWKLAKFLSLEVSSELMAKTIPCPQCPV